MHTTAHNQLDGDLLWSLMPADPSRSEHIFERFNLLRLDIGEASRAHFITQSGGFQKHGDQIFLSDIFARACRPLSRRPPSNCAPLASGIAPCASRHRRMLGGKRRPNRVMHAALFHVSFAFHHQLPVEVKV